MWQRWFRPIGFTLLASTAWLAGCGGGIDNPVLSTRTPQAPDAPAGGPPDDGFASLGLAPPIGIPETGRVALSWRSNGGLSRFSVWIAPDASAPFAEVTGGLTGSAAEVERGASWKLDFPTARVRLRGCKDDGTTCVESNVQPLGGALLNTVQNLRPLVEPDSRTHALKLNADGRTLVALQGPPSPQDQAQGITTWLSILQRDSEGRWQRQARLPGMYTSPTRSGQPYPLAVSADGNTVVVASREPEGSPARSGAIAVLVRNGAQWTQQALLQADEPAADEELGTHLALSADGSRIATNGAQRVVVFERDTQGHWRQDTVFASAPGDPHPLLPTQSLALSGDGNVLVSAAYGGFDGTSLTEPYYSLRVFLRDCLCRTWQQKAELRSDLWPYDDFEPFSDSFAESVALDFTGDTIAVGTQTAGGYRFPGGAYVYKRQGDTWARSATIVNGEGLDIANDTFARDIALSSDGRVITSSTCAFYVNRPGVNRNHREGDSGHPFGDGRCLDLAAAAYVWTADDAGAWHHTATLMPRRSTWHASYPTTFSGTLTALSADAQTIAVGLSFFDDNPDHPERYGLYIH